jgi:pilus assembly protein Flp/PilA
MKDAMLDYLNKIALLRDRKGVTALEYGLIAGVFGLVLISSLKGLGSTLSGLFVKIGTSI